MNVVQSTTGTSTPPRISCAKEYVSRSSKDRSRAGHARIYARGHRARPRRRAEGAAVDEARIPCRQAWGVSSLTLTERSAGKSKFLTVFALILTRESFVRITFAAILWNKPIQRITSKANCRNPLGGRGRVSRGRFTLSSAERSPFKTSGTGTLNKRFCFYKSCARR